MANIHYTFFAVLSALLLAVPLAHGGYTVNGTDIIQINVLGRLYCSVDGAPVPNFNTPGADGVNVDLVCKPVVGDKISLARTVTNATGHFEAIVATQDTHNVFDPSVCYIEVALPVANCELFPPKGVLQATILLLDIVNTLMGAIAKFLSNTFQHVAAT